ncbi:heparan sulfate 2-O-sulfotransferase pipe isoform X4 [Bactrocera dorsalis]|uniref:Heparan sulfate 2-O-sulfotransferase pipe isoform X4 n=2 Tax=Bactrocera dorsalis TaxID=27457 RepID=A0A8N4QHX4_BACDO|nr:heparan sulfate 2-O-sulfotransferase pipe isoform X4 [Bactrocera dorsalis]
MSLGGEKSFKMRMRDMENAFKYRRIPYPKRSVELIAILAISCTFFLFMHTNKLNSRLKEMEIKLQPSEFSALGLTGNQISPRESSRRDNINTLHGTYQYLKSTGQLRSLSTSSLNNTRKADIDILFFNRCAKVGSESMIQLLGNLETINGFNLDHFGPGKGTRRNLPPREQERVADYVFRLGAGSAYVEHISWINFYDFGLPKPIYINLVRDPVERVISWYFYARNAYKNAWVFRKNPNANLKSAVWFKKDFNECVRSGDPECQYVPYTFVDSTGNFKRQSLFFCGQNLDCLPFDSPYAIQMAKDRVEREYAVVGSWEETNVTLTVLENYIPLFFSGAKRVYYLNKESLENRNRNNRKPYVAEDVKQMIRKNFTNEYDFYHFCKQRLFKQYLALNHKEFPIN